MENAFYIRTIKSLIKLMNDKGLSQARMAELAGTSPSQFSKMLKFQVKLSFDHISNLATNLQMSELDLFTYPDRYVKAGSSDQEPLEAILQIKLKKDKKDQVLRLIFGDNNIEILNK